MEKTVRILILVVLVGIIGYFATNPRLLAEGFSGIYIITLIINIIILMIIYLSLLLTKNWIKILGIAVCSVGIYFNYLSVVYLAGIPYFNFIWYFIDLFDKPFIHSVRYQVWIYLILIFIYFRRIILIWRKSQKLPTQYMS